MKWFLGFALLVSAISAGAQSVSPLVVECGRKCAGSFTVSNSGVQPVTVTVEPFSFGLAPDGHSLFRALDKAADVTLHETSARVGPQADHTFDYSIQCAAAPCQVALVTAMVVGHTTEGIAIRLVVPHIVYQCDKAKGCRANVRKAAGLTN